MGGTQMNYPIITGWEINGDSIYIYIDDGCDVWLRELPLDEVIYKVTKLKSGSVYGSSVNRYIVGD